MRVAKEGGGAVIFIYALQKVACSKLLIGGDDRASWRVTSGVWGLGLETELPNPRKMGSDVITLKQKCCYL